MSFQAIITADVKGLETGVDKAGQAIDKLAKTANKKLADIGKSFENAGKKASILSAGLVAVGAKAFLMAADVEDAVGATEQIFKENAESVNAWAANLDSSFGIAKKEALEYSNLMGSMLINIGKLTEQEASKQSAKLIELAGDLTAMYGGSTQDAVRALTGALKGNNTMLDNYGMAVNEALIKQKALELGLMDTSGEMTLQAKQGATLALIWEQTGAAQGQAAREAKGASGSMRALKTEIINLTTELGDVLLPVITPIITRLKEFISGLRDLSPEAKGMILIVGGIVAAIGPLLLILGKIVRGIPNMLLGFKALKVAVMATGGAFAKLGVIIAANPIGAIAVGITAVIAALVIFNRRLSDTATLSDKIMTDALKNTAGERVEVERLLRVLNSENATREQKEEILRKLNKISPEYFKNIKLEGDAVKKTNEQAIAYNKSLVEKARLQVINEKLVELERKRIDELEGGGDSKLSFWQKLVRNMLIGDGQMAASDTYVTEVREKNAEKSKTAYETQRDALLALLDAAEDIATAAEPTATAAEDIATAAEDIATAAERTAVAVATIARESNIEPIVGAGITMLEVEPVVIPPIDYDPYAKSLEEMNAITLDYGSLISSGLADFASSVGEAFAEGNFEGLGSGLISAMGDMISQFGEMLIAAGIAAVALKVLIKNPWTAIAAGIALVALGAAVSAAAQGTVNKATGGGGGGSMGGTNSYNKTSQLGDSSYRGAYRDEWDSEVVFKIGNNELVGTLERANTRRERL